MVSVLRVSVRLIRKCFKYDAYIGSVAHKRFQSNSYFRSLRRWDVVVSVRLIRKCFKSSTWLGLSPIVSVRLIRKCSREVEAAAKVNRIQVSVRPPVSVSKSSCGRHNNCRTKVSKRKLILFSIDTWRNGVVLRDGFENVSYECFVSVKVLLYAH